VVARSLASQLLVGSTLRAVDLQKPPSTRTVRPWLQ